MNKFNWTGLQIYCMAKRKPVKRCLVPSLLKASPNDELSIGRTLFFQRVENILKKVKTANYQHFLLYPQCLKNLYLNWSLLQMV